MRAGLIVSGVVAGCVALWLANRNNGQSSSYFTGVGQGVSDTVVTAVEAVGSEIMNLTIRVRDAVPDRNVQAFLRLIRTGEGTTDAGGYSRLFGGKAFAGFADHPRVSVPFGSTYSTAAGAYQILSRTWDEIAGQYSLPDFTPANQDIAAVALIKRRGALADVLAGRFKTAIQKCNKEWASLPESPYGQPTLTMSRAGNILAGLGVQSIEVVA